MIADQSRWRRTRLFLLVAVTLTPFSSDWTWGEEVRARPQEAGTEERLALADLIQEALENNPEIQAARQSWEAARARPSQARSLPDPEISFGLRNIGTNYSVGREDMSVLGGSFIQQIPFPGKRALRAQVEVSRFLQQLETLEARKESLKARINALLNRHPDAPLGRPAGFERSRLPGALAELSEQTVQDSPRLKADERSIAQRESSLALARKEYLPDLSFNGAFSYRGGLREMWEGFVGFTIPLYFRTKQDYGVREAQANLRGAYRGLEATKQALLSQLKELYVEATTAQRIAELFRSGIIPQATLSMESAQAGYQVGKVDFLTVLDNVVRLLNDELAYQEEVVKCEKAVAQINEIIGKE